MGKFSNDIKEKTGMLEEFCEITKKINELLETTESIEQLDVIVSEVEKRDKIIAEINIVNKILEDNQLDEQDQAELGEQDQLWFDLFAEIQKIEVKNAAKMQQLRDEYMGKVKSAKDSIKVIDAYARQMMETDSVSIDKTK